MAKPRRIAFIGNSLPRRCGIATFTTDLQHAVATTADTVETCIVAMNDHGNRYDYPAAVGFQINDERIGDYLRAAEFLNAGRFDAVSLQHEYGIFGGEAGELVLSLLTRLTMPIVTTLHTVLAAPTVPQRDVLERIIAISSRVIVMAERGCRLLRDVYRVPVDKIEIIPHGIPDVAFVEPDEAKTKLGFAGRTVILTFGLLSPNKGIETMIDAMPKILASRADALYVVLGATHPNLVRREGETYRESLQARTRVLGVEDHVVFLDQFVDQATLLDYIAMCDVYVTPYLNEAQMTSGTLAYSFGLGKAVVSTPYWHAQELLADERGILVPFGDAAATGSEIAGLLTDEGRRQDLRRHAYASSRSMTWAHTAERYLASYERVSRTRELKVVAGPKPGEKPVHHERVPPGMALGHFLSMCDDTGLLQHAVYAVPDRSHGYCVDDNARALLLACLLSAQGETRLPEVMTARFAAFVQHAWNPDTRRFRNFMGYDRRWLEDKGSEDSHGRTLWALGICAHLDACASRRRWAAALFTQALAPVEAFSSPRAWAFTLLGLVAYRAIARDDDQAAKLQTLLADRLLALLATNQTASWAWFEAGLAYDNARLPQALLVTGAANNVVAYSEAGARTLRWLMTLQTTPAGRFRPVGTEGFGRYQREAPQAFDQQPLEATAAIASCLAAWRVYGDSEWRDGAVRAFAWFFGGNDLSTPLVDTETGGCRDGLHPDRANENRGGESVVSYLLSLVEMRQLTRISEVGSKVVPPQVLRPPTT